MPDSFIIEGDKTSAGASVMQVQLNLTYPNDPDLTATLTHFGPGGTNLGTVTLFSGVGAGTSTANFDNTVFDDNAATPIQNGGAPFFATFSPQQSLATVFAPGPNGVNVQGTWVLTITNNNLTTTNTGTLTAWSLAFQKPVPTSGLGEPGSDDYTASFRIFTLAPSDSLSSEEWTPVGPASIGGGSTGNSADPSGRVTGLAIDPSDPSGNTVYAAGASGGVWKTTDFLTTAAAGPTWIPLTNFGPTNGVNIGGIAVFARNNDPNQSIIIAATGEGDTGTPGVGFLISEDGGQTWNLADSTDNVDASGNFLPINSSSRDRVFVGDTSFSVVVDPEPTPSGGVIIYAAMSGPTGGIWRSENTGQTWTQMLAGQATDVVLDPDSGTTLDPVTGTYVQGNLQVVYAAIRGTGVFMSPNQGQIWNQMLGGTRQSADLQHRDGPLQERQRRQRPDAQRRRGPDHSRRPQPDRQRRRGRRLRGLALRASSPTPAAPSTGSSSPRTSARTGPRSTSPPSPTRATSRTRPSRPTTSACRTIPSSGPPSSPRAITTRPWPSTRPTPVSSTWAVRRTATSLP